jgi:ABC-type polar amino acid transport system ATPase subunit
VLLLDEPTSALDPARRKDVTKLLVDLATQGTTLVIATHDIPFAKDVATRAGLLDAGLLVREGAVDDVMGS